MNPEVAPNPNPVGEAQGARPLLTICVPTYNRGEHLAALVRSLIIHVLDRPEFDCELVVADNASIDDTAARLLELDHPRLRKMRHETHLNTVEENLVGSLKWVRGLYVWFLGDDEVIRLEILPELFARLKAGEHGLLVFNSPTISLGGRWMLERPLPMNAGEMSLSVPELVEAVGLTYVFAGISNLVQKTDNLIEQVGRDWIARSVIYSHVAWFIDAQRHERALFVNRGLVHYRQNTYDGDHWKVVAERLGVQNLYFWSLGLTRLIESLVEGGAIGYARIGLVLEVNALGSRYRLIDEVAANLHRQLGIYAESGQERQAISRAEMAQAVNVLLACDPMLFDLLRLISRVRDRLEAAAPGDRTALFAETLNAFQTTFDERLAGGSNRGRWVGVINDYAVYRGVRDHIAIDSNDVAERERVLQTVDPLAQGDFVITAGSLEEIERRTRAGRMRLLLEPGRTARQGGADVAPSVSTEAAELARSEARASRAELDAVRSSTSWRITAPVRRLIGLVRRPSRA